MYDLFPMGKYRIKRAFQLGQTLRLHEEVVMTSGDVLYIPEGIDGGQTGGPGTRQIETTASISHFHPRKYRYEDQEIDFSIQRLSVFSRIRVELSLPGSHARRSLFATSLLV